MSKSLSIILITFLSLIVAALIFVLCVLLNNKNFNFSSFNITTGVSQKLVEEKEIDNIKDLNITTNTSDVYIEESDRSNIKVELYSDNPKKYEITEEGNSIKVVFENKKNAFFNFMKKSPAVKIYVPITYSNNIVIDNEVGDTKINNLGNATLDIVSDVGDVKIKEIKEVNAKVRVGDIKIEKVKKLTSDIKTGDTKVTLVDDIISKTKTGDIKIINVNNSLNIESKTGDVKIENATINKNSKISSNVGDIKIKNIDGCYIEGKTRVGDTKINNNNRKSDIILNITSNVGDIKVNY